MPLRTFATRNGLFRASALRRPLFSTHLPCIASPALVRDVQSYDQRTPVEKEMTDSSTPTMTLIITCPVCAASGTMIHHDLRSSLIYSCLNCTHEWQIDPAVEAAPTKPKVIERRGTPSPTKDGITSY